MRIPFPESLHTSLKANKTFRPSGLAALYLFGLAARAAGLPLVSIDMTGYLIPWYDTLARQGFSALSQSFSNYTPPYLYLLWLVTLTQAFIPKIIGIKLLSVAFDLLNTFMVFRIVKLKVPQGFVAHWSAAIFWALPTIILNSAWWGQADAVFTFFLLLSLYSLLKERPLAAVLLFGIAFAIKAQAIFLAPFLLLLALKKRIPWFYFLLAPLVYLILMLPAVAAGRPLLDTLTVYWGQANTYKHPSAMAPNLYLFIPGSLYAPTVIGGLAAAALLMFAWVFFYARKIQSFTPGTLLLCAAGSAVAMPYILPLMHERYFYLADILIFLLAFYLPSLWMFPLASQIVSILTYSVFLFPLYDQNQVLAVLMVAAAIIINTLLVTYLLRKQYQLIREERITDYPTAS